MAEFQRGQLMEQDHRIAEITHYELWEDKAEVYYYDFFGSVWRVNGVNQLAQMNAMLRIAIRSTEIENNRSAMARFLSRARISIRHNETFDGARCRKVSG